MSICASVTCSLCTCFVWVHLHVGGLVRMSSDTRIKAFACISFHKHITPLHLLPNKFRVGGWYFFNYQLLNANQNSNTQNSDKDDSLHATLIWFNKELMRIRNLPETLTDNLTIDPSHKQAIILVSLDLGKRSTNADSFIYDMLQV